MSDRFIKLSAKDNFFEVALIDSVALTALRLKENDLLKAMNVASYIAARTDLSVDDIEIDLEDIAV